MGLDIYIDKRTRKKKYEDFDTLAYFRKINFLIPFFEQYCGKIENCEYISITQEMCKELVKTCNKVINDPSKAKQLLPTTNGFFFGSTDYDEYYIQDLEEVKHEFLNNVIPEFKNLEEGEDICFYIWY